MSGERTIPGQRDGADGYGGAAVVRALVFFGLWMLLIGIRPGDLAAGIPTALAANWLSLRLLPPRRVRLRLAALPTLVLRFLWQSLRAGFDVAVRAMDPRSTLRPGLVAYQVRFAPGLARQAFAALTSLMPGTLPAGEEDGALLYHCLDLEQPVLAQLAAEEAALRRLLAEEPSDG